MLHLLQLRYDDDHGLELATVTGSVAREFVASLTVAVEPRPASPSHSIESSSPAPGA